MLIDSHCHLDDYEDLPAILAHARAAGVGKLLAIGIGDGPDTMHRALDIAHTYPEVFATAGIHPQEAHRATPEALAKLTTLAQDPRCLAIGEIGLDYYHLDNPDIPTQQAAFVAQMKIADAWEDLLRLIHEHWTPTNLPGIMHCFSGNADQAARSLAAGFYLSFAGNVTYPKSTTIQAVAASAPADRILVETDAPFLAPTPLRGQTNEPAYVAHTARFVAALRGISPDDLAEITTSNFDALFPASLSV
jgi:TatD DNase family protein